MPTDPQFSQGQSTDPLNKRKQWPMWPIFVAITAFIIFYTWVQLNFRKAEQPFLPYESRQVSDAEKNFYGWYSLKTSKAASEIDSAAIEIEPQVREVPLEQALPSQIIYYLPRRPLLVPRLSPVKADSFYLTGQAIHVSLSLPKAIGESPAFKLSAFYKDSDLILLAEVRLESMEDLPSFEDNDISQPYNFEILSNPVESDFVNVKLFSENTVSEWTIRRRSS